MGGIYIHIPFCKRKCVYCNFYSIANLSQKEHLVKALSKELVLRKQFLQNEKIETIYLGGGTPSLLSMGDINGLIDQIGKYYSIAGDAEITLEANPDDLSADYLSHLSRSPVNRLSIGIQSFFDEDLKYLKRIHTAGQGLNSVLNAGNAGFTNLSIDLIYGIPTLTNANWLENIQKSVDLKLTHISCYSLTVEPGTLLPKLIHSGKAMSLDEDQSVDHFQVLISEMSKNGYIHYEISNFSLPGKMAVHNTNYWRGKKYLGLGPSAHSYDGNQRYWNIASVEKYINEIESGKPEPESELLSVKDRYNEYVMTSIRTMWGVDAGFIGDTFGNSLANHFKMTIQSYILSGFVIQKRNKYFLTDEGKLFSDRIASDLFVVENEKDL